ncbi:septation ring formation regulator EzrA [Lactobacillus delbrueckii]|uniref:Septation ring formation regulator EzrA n=1 Tax=Lactobacillus delbrueckii subsp. bulgaricus (strain ATCC 11842 / DSM 20081 / BCRC 10696 / JCM 1002 / NBRC 13953 / NCIMB 11778 / NCTC 12712 / WDCM 00102 / Lb 14) TaxID=390333 RepID=Q1GAV3_LACDA|nr:septation ring formation regulator EzrA [Lactobacillus delbrueckii]KIY25029.1 septation ring formation regulator EzrA [Lactobacillus delbrueckii subsp. bulgaricus]MBT9022910.1 septation ring formation regulator EzrA [Lactobacillus delbrueckii subsp. bulgaricus]MCD5449017.1 septation ring formation regulator EzrA [Lactobacillus delbrueckii subsp. bulgaricus]MCD5459621.1 septation ring formation regulator EzrA [Lactobacillus delbrueckii subsp. bulgaricus]MCD5462842.1 septation ring formation 
MSSTQSLLLITLIITIIVVVMAMLLINRRQLRDIEELDNELGNMEDLHLERAIGKLDQMELAGESLATLNTWKKSYQKAAELFPEIQRLIEDGADENARYHLVKSHQSIKQARELVDSVSEDVKNSSDVFTQLLESNRENKAQYDELMQSYWEIRKEILADSFDYSVALEEIENRLSAMEEDFAQAKNLSAQGDHVEAKRVLSKIRADLTALKTKLPEVKEDQHDLQTVFADQLDEIAAGYKEMRDAKYGFGSLDVLLEIRQSNDQIDRSLAALAQLDLEETSKGMKKVEKEIKTLYGILEKEYKARPFVEKNQDKLQRLLTHQQTVSQQLIKKLRHIDESYELTHGELDESRELEREVHKMDSDYIRASQRIADGRAVYSEVQDDWIKILGRLQEIGKRQQELSEAVDGLYEAEEVAQRSIKEFKQQVSLVYRHLSRQNLPGIPEGFLQMYTLVVNEISKTSGELNQVRINMEKISEELVQISDDVDRLQREAEDIISSANLFELTMQYSNKFLDNETVVRARRNAMKLYDRDYNYKDALDTIATAVERAEPGSYQRIENAYYQEQKELID